MNRVAKLLSVVAFLSFFLVLPSYGQASDAAVQSNIELGGFAGMLFFSDSDLPSFATFGIAGGAYISPGVEIGLAYSRAGISFFGIELMSINLFDAFVSVDLSPAERFGILLRLGGSYLQVNALGEGIGRLRSIQCSIQEWPDKHYRSWHSCPVLKSSHTSQIARRNVLDKDVSSGV